MNIMSVRLRNFYGWTNKHLDHIIYICIALTVVAFNLIAIFGLDGLLHDDPACYFQVLKGKFPRGLMKHSLICPYKEWIAWNIMAYSPNLIRGLYVMFLMIPLSWCFYYLYHYKFGFSRITAFTAAILPNILPYQWQIPAGINMSYTLWGLLFSVFSLIIGLHYLEKTTSKNWIRLLGAIICYFIASQLMGQSLFIFPPLALAFLGYTKFNKKHIWLISSVFIVAMAKFIWMIAVPRKPVIGIPTEVILRRIGLYFKWSLPSPNIEPIYLTIIYVVIILIGFILYIRDADSRLTLINRNFFHIEKKVYVLYFYTFFICWSVSSIFVFICMSEYLLPRYTHISSFGLNAIFIFSIYIILNRGFFKKYKLYIFVFLGIIIFSGIFRYSNLKKIYTVYNNTQSIIVRDLNKLKFPFNSQVVISGRRVRKLFITRGWWGASGYLKFALKRNDINGLIGGINSKGYYNFDNHFNPKERGWGARYSMTGLSINKPTFFFFMLKKQKKLKQFEYALQWKGKTKNAPWTILRANKRTGKITPLLSGTGWDEYLSTIKKLEKKGTSQSEILWGGPPCKKELERMGFDPIFFHSDFDNRFKNIESSRAKQVLLISPKTTAPIAKNIYFGNRFQLVLSFSYEAINRGRAVSKLIHILWKSMIKQKMKKHLLELTLLKNQKTIYRRYLKFCHPGLELEPGDYIFGSVKIPADKFKEAKNLGIRMFIVKKAQKWTGLRIQGNHKTDQGGFRLLIPIK
jgi:hypothetical protein